MDFDYSEENYEFVLESIKRGRDKNVCKIRAEIYGLENKFFSDRIRDKNVLVAGSGLGHDSFELAKYNKLVVGVDLLEGLVQKSRKLALEKGLDNVSFEVQDFFYLPYYDKEFDVSVLNSGTICNYVKREDLLKELFRVSDKVVFDYYLPGERNLKRRLAMYGEEGFHGSLYLDGEKFFDEAGFVSYAVENKELSDIARSLGAKIKIYSLFDFVNMAELYK